MTNDNGAHAAEPEAAIAQASNDMIDMAVQRNAEAEVQREAQVVIDNVEWNALTPQQEAEAEQAYFAQRAAEAEAEAEREIEDPEAEIG